MFTDNELLAIKAGYVFLWRVNGVTYWRHPDGGEANYVPNFLPEPSRVQVEKMKYEGKRKRVKVVSCPRCHKPPFLMITVLGTVVYVCPTCLYHEEPWQRGN